MGEQEREYAEVSSLAIRLRQFLYYIIDVFGYMAFGMIIAGGVLVSFVISSFIGFWFIGLGVMISFIVALLLVWRLVTVVRIGGSGRIERIVFAIVFASLYIIVPLTCTILEPYVWYSILWQLALGVSFVIIGFLKKNSKSRLNIVSGLTIIASFTITLILALYYSFILAWMFALGAMLLVYFGIAAYLLMKGLQVVTGEH